MKNIVVLVSGSGSNLQAIIDVCQSSYINAKVTAVISNNESAYALERAKKANIATHILLNQNFSSRTDYDNALIDIIEPYKPDLIVLAGFMRILSAPFVEHYLGKLINIHPSLLPLYPGLNTHQKVLDNQDKDHGATVHFVTAKLDAGPIILQGKFAVNSCDTAESLIQKTHQEEHKIYPLAVKLFCDDRICMKDDICFFDNQPAPKNGLNIKDIS